MDKVMIDPKLTEQELADFKKAADCVLETLKKFDAVACVDYELSLMQEGFSALITTLKSYIELII
jgi:hypothetical protein